MEAKKEPRQREEVREYKDEAGRGGGREGGGREEVGKK